MEYNTEYIKEIFSEKIIKAVISNPKSTSATYRRIQISLIENDSKTVYNIEKFTEKQVVHENVEVSKIAEMVSDIMCKGYHQIDAWGEDFSYSVKVSKKGKTTLLKKRLSAMDRPKISTTHNREKNYILKENTLIPPLTDLGIFTKDGKIVNSMYDKYKQINRFIEIIDDVLKNFNEREINILDFGCGKSYLTFVVYYYLTEIKKIKTNITGLDLKADVIAKCNALSEKYGYENLRFKVGDINGYKCETSPDVVITLHACDTATDFALYNAINWGAKVILSVPCCQHELNSQIKAEKLDILTKYGLIKERFSALATDSIRGSLLESCGYNVQLMEFVDFAHSPKNLLIRATKRNVSLEKREKCIHEAEQLMKEFNFKPTLYELLKNK